VLAAVSPEVVIPLLFNLQTKGNYGKEKGIPTIIIAAASFDDIVAISAFGVLISIATSTGDCSIHLYQYYSGYFPLSEEYLILKLFPTVIMVTNQLNNYLRS
jgi:NhaP-type Na+/H+ or K+/H+ antiporter